jgi:serine/threonine protein kinase
MPANQPQPVQSSDPSPDELEAYRRGSLDPKRFDEVDRWLDEQDAETQARLLEGPEPSGSFQPLAAALKESASANSFSPSTVGTRYRTTSHIGVGGMGVVELVRDDVLGRDVAIKRCRPRQPDESMADYALRLRSFRREAAITAQLEHPAIVPVHDVGVGQHGEPAFVMKRLEGVPLSDLVKRRQPGQKVDLAEVAQIMLRVAEALAYAHARGFVHRDLKPDNVFVGQLGAVSVIDWGLAAKFGDQPATIPELNSSGLTSFGAGTPAWMAPEQFQRLPASPTMDVFALGGLLMAVLTGSGPRGAGDGKNPDVDLAPLLERGLPRGLVAITRRCLELDPTNRYPDGGSVAADLRNWLSAGLTSAEQPSVIRRAYAYLKNSPRFAAILFLSIALIGSVAYYQHWRHTYQAEVMRLRIKQIVDGANLDDVVALRANRQEVQNIIAGMSDLAEAKAADARLETAIEALDRRAELQDLRERLLNVAKNYRRRGPWISEIRDITESLHFAGIMLKNIEEDSKITRSHPLHDELLSALVQLQRALLLNGSQDRRIETIPKVIIAATDKPSWHALADLLQRAQASAHDLIFCECPASEAALADPQTADLLLATYGPDRRLVDYASQRIKNDLGAFWPRVVSARAAYQNNRIAEAKQHALVALGQEPYGLWPHLILAYVALSEDEMEPLLQEAEIGLSTNADHRELLILKAVALARTGHRPEAQALIDAADVASHLQYHLQHPVGHPMETSVRALVKAGVVIAKADPALGPVVPNGASDAHEHH